MHDHHVAITITTFQPINNALVIAHMITYLVVQLPNITRAGFYVTDMGYKELLTMHVFGKELIKC